MEILVHYDASTDGSVAHVRERYPDVTQIESDTKIGFCIANNPMMTRARGQFILLSNNDASLSNYAGSSLEIWGDGENVREVVLDTSLLNRQLGWIPSVGLADDLGLTWQWLRRPL